jgi:hypothetical protein
VIPILKLDDAGGQFLPVYVIFTQLLPSVEDTDATNELINDKEDVQLMTYEEIEALKGSGAHVQVHVLVYHLVCFVPN